MRFKNNISNKFYLYSNLTVRRRLLIKTKHRRTLGKSANYLSNSAVYIDELISLLQLLYFMLDTGFQWHNRRWIYCYYPCFEMVCVNTKQSTIKQPPPLWLLYSGGWRPHRTRAKTTEKWTFSSYKTSDRITSPVFVYITYVAGFPYFSCRVAFDSRLMIDV